MQSNRKILIITYYWPPSGGVGVQRWVNYALQLQKQGWDPIILTPENPQFSLRDEHLVEKVKELKTYKIKIWEPFSLFHTLTGGKNRKEIQQGLVLEKPDPSFLDRLFVWIRGNLFIPDPRRFWVRTATREAIRIIKQEKVPILITTGPPHSMHLIGLKVQNRLKIKWLADFRDPWTKWDILEKLKVSSWAMKIHQHMEEKVTESADLAITTSTGMAEALKIKAVLRNGVSLPEMFTCEPPADTFVIGYFGLLNDMRNPAVLWLALDQICREDSHFHEKLEIRIGGIISEALMSELRGFEMIGSKFNFLGYLPHNQIFDYYQSCHLLLLLQNKTNNAAWILPVKYFEYVASRRIILALGKRNSELAEAMREYDIGELFEYDDASGIRDFIRYVFEERKLPHQEDSDKLIEEFSHEEMGKKLENFLLQMLNEKQSVQ